jgi:multiple sugar transport system substrate-binding protein
VAFLTGERSERLLFERGGLPATRTSVYYDPQVKAAYPFAERLREAFDRAHRRPTVAHYAQFSQAFRADALTYLRNNEPLDETRLRDDLEEALKGRWPRVGS